MRTYFDIEDLRTIRDLAQKYVEKGKLSRWRAVQAATKAVRAMKKYFNK